MLMEKFEAKHAAAIVLVFLSILLWGFFLSSSAFSLNDIFELNYNAAWHNVATLDFVLFIALFPLTYALVAAFSSRIEKNAMQITALAGAIAGMVAVLLLFPAMQQFSFVWVFFLASISLLIEVHFMKMAELKKLIFSRSAGSAMGKATRIIAVGLFLLAIFTVLPQQEAYVAKFEKTIFEETLSGAGIGNLSDQLANVVITSQKSTITAIVSSAQYQNLNDAEFKAFIAALNDAVGSEQYKEQIVQQISAQGDSAFKTQNLIDIVKKQLPLFGVFEQYLWLIIGFLLVSVFLLISGLVIQPLGIVYSVGLEKIIKILFK